MQNLTPRRVTAGLALIHASYVVMLLYFISGHWYVVFSEPMFRDLVGMSGLTAGLLIEAVGLWQVWRGLGTAASLQLARRLFLAAVVVATAAAGIGTLYALGIVVHLASPDSEFLWTVAGALGHARPMSHPASVQIICFGLTIFAIVRLGTALGHRFWGIGDIYLSVFAVAVAVSPFLPLGHLGDVLIPSIFFGQPLFGLLLWLVWGSLPATSGRD